MYDSYRADEKQLERLLEKLELDYYATALLWMRILQVKAKQGDSVLTIQEDILKTISDESFNVPQPLYVYLKEIGTYSDKMGKETRLELSPLPVTVVQHFGGYHAPAVDENTFTLFEEVPSLGIAGVMVMAIASNTDNPVLNFQIAKQQGTIFTDNLVGILKPIGPPRTEIIQRLAGYGITASQFREYILGTRFNLRYIRSISDILGKFESFKVEKEL